MRLEYAYITPLEVIPMKTRTEIYGNAAAVDGIIDRIEEELGQKVTVIATGGMSRKIVPHCKREMILDGDLLLKGLQIIYDKNK